jgi:hypothetical protein
LFHRVSLTNSILPADSRLKTIDGFEQCTILGRIDIPRPIEIISLGEAIFASGLLIANRFAEPIFLHLLNRFQIAHHWQSSQGGIVLD